MNIAVSGDNDEGEVGFWVENGFDVLGSTVDPRLTKGSVVEDTLSLTVGFKDVCEGLTRDTVDSATEAGVLGFKDVLGGFVDKVFSAIVVSLGKSDRVVSVAERSAPLDGVVDFAKGVVAREVNGVEAVVKESVPVLTMDVKSEASELTVTPVPPVEPVASIPSVSAVVSESSVASLASSLTVLPVPAVISVLSVAPSLTVLPIPAVISVVSVAPTPTVLPLPSGPSTLSGPSVPSVSFIPSVASVPSVAPTPTVSSVTSEASVVSEVSLASVLMMMVLPPLEASEVMVRSDVPISEVSTGLVLEVKLESSLTVGVVVASVGWVVMSGDWFEGVVIGMVESNLVEPDWVESDLVESGWVESDLVESGLVDSDWDESDLVVSGLVVSGD